MKPRKPKKLKDVLKKKGFVVEPKKNHHEFYYFKYKGKKHNVYTYFSHGKKEYDSSLMTHIKKQLKFKETANAENFFDCPMSAEDYVNMLKKNGDL